MYVTAKYKSDIARVIFENSLKIACLNFEYALMLKYTLSVTQ